MKWGENKNKVVDGKIAKSLWSVSECYNSETGPSHEELLSVGWRSCSASRNHEENLHDQLSSLANWPVPFSHWISSLNVGNIITAWLEASSINKRDARSIWNWHYCLRLPADCQVSRWIRYRDSSRLSRIDCYLFLKLCCQPAPHLHIIIII